MRLTSLSSFILLEWFLWINVSFLALDIFFAHSINNFRSVYEWTPLVFSVLSMIIHGSLLLKNIRNLEQLKDSTILRYLGIVSCFVGLLGMFFHLESHFFKQQTFSNLIYTAPFIAPLAYVGIGFLYIINRCKNMNSNLRFQLILLAATLGFVGNFILSLFDHAQNGFYRYVEWIPVFTSILVISGLLPMCLGFVNELQVRLSYFALGLQILTGIIGTGYHFISNLTGKSSWWDNFIYGAPIFAPLLFINISVLAFIAFKDFSVIKQSGDIEEKIQEKNLLA